jgi:heptosyltransferase-2
MQAMQVRISTVRSLSEAKNILIRGTNWIGDAVMTLPALTAVRKSFPDARISVLAKPWVAEIYRISPAVDEIILFQSPGIHAGIRGKIRLAQELRRMNFDMALLLQNAIEAAIIAWLAKIPIRAGYNSDGRGLLLTHSIKRTKAVRQVHQTRYYLEMVKSLGCRTEEADVFLRLGKDIEALAETTLNTLGIDSRAPIIGLAPGATYGPAKKWFPDRFAEVADRLIQGYDAQVIAFGSPDDRETGDEVQGNARNPLRNLAGRTSLQETIALISRCDLFISNDSGLMHVAGALNIPTVALFGSTNPATTSPVGDHSRIIYKGASCSPCLKKTCPTDFRCMDAIRVDEVYAVAEGLLTRDGKNGKKTAAIFLDRDGTINEEVGHLDNLEKLKLYDNAAEAIRLINESGMKAVVITNQSGVARGYFTEELVKTAHRQIQDLLKQQGAFIDAFYYCPHHPTEGLEEYVQACSCRKPEPGMLIAASRDLHIDLQRSYMVGDILKDIQTGKRAGAKSVLVKSGHGIKTLDEDLVNGTEKMAPEDSLPDYIAEDILDAVTWILQDREK